MMTSTLTFLAPLLALLSVDEAIEPLVDDVDNKCTRCDWLCCGVEESTDDESCSMPMFWLKHANGVPGGVC